MYVEYIYVVRSLNLFQLWSSVYSIKVLKLADLLIDKDRFQRKYIRVINGQLQIPIYIINNT